MLNSKKSRYILMGCLFVVLVATIASIAIWFNSSKRADPDMKKAYDEVELNVAPNKEFTFKIGLKGNDFSYGKEELFRVYEDPDLKREVSTLIYKKDFSSDEIFIKPSGNPSEATAYDRSTRKEIKLTNRGEWPLAQKLYLAQLCDLDNGEKLEKPVVTMFTVKRELVAPVVNRTVESNGALRLSWNKVDGAGQYYIIKYETRYHEGSSSKLATIIGKTKKTQWMSTDGDRFGELAGTTVYMNEQFTGYDIGNSEDSKYNSNSSL